MRRDYWFCVEVEGGENNTFTSVNLKLLIMFYIGETHYISKVSITFGQSHTMQVYELPQGYKEQLMRLLVSYWGNMQLINFK